MKKLFWIFFLCSFLSFGQTTQFQYKNTPLAEILEDLEDTFNVYFSFNSSLIKNQFVTYSESADLPTILNSISEELNLDFKFLDKENIIIKSSFDLSGEAFNSLDEVILVSEYLTSGFNKNKGDGSITMNPNRLEVLPGLTEPDVLQSLQLIPGISSPTETAANLNIRGGTPDQNLVIYDGIRIYHQGHLFGMISPFNPYIVESVDVYRSGTSAAFGERISGVIDIQSMSDIPQTIEGGAGANFLNADVFVKAPIVKDKAAIFLSVRRSLNDILGLPTFDSFSDKVFQNTKIEATNDIISEEELTILDDTFEFLDLNAKLVVQPNSKNRFSLSTLFVDNSLNYAGIDQEMNGTRDELKLDNFGISGNWSYAGNSFAVDASFRYSSYNSDYKFTQLPESLLNEGIDKQNSVKDLGLQLKLTSLLDEYKSLSYGYDFTQFNVDYNLVFREDSLEQENESNKLGVHSTFLEMNFNSGKFNARFGARASYFVDNSTFYFEPRIYIDYKVNEEWKLKTSAEIKNQGISQLVSFEFNELGLDETIWVLTDEDDGIPVLNNKQVTFGVEYSKNKWLLDVEGYYKKVSGLTSLTRGFSNNSQSDPDYYQGSSDAFGIDILIKKKIKNFRTWIGYSFSKTDFSFPELQDSKFPGTFDQRHVLSWSNTYKYDQFQFSLGWQFITGKPFSNPSGIVDDELVYNDLNNERLPNYHRLDASALYNFYLDSGKKWKARFGVSFINIYARDNDIDKSFSINDDDSEIIEQSTIGLGFTPNMVFRVTF